MTLDQSRGDLGTARDGLAGLLELQDISKVFTSRHDTATAVADVTLTIQPGQFVTLLGPSGCGKTTTLRMIAGFESPTSGDILLDGTSIVRTPPNKRPMSMVFQSYALFPHLTVFDNIGFGLRVQHVDKGERDVRIRKAMELTGIETFGDRHPNELSGGQQQRVALSRALVREPKMLRFDEPLSNLDAKLRLRMRDEIRAIQQRLQITSVFVTHDQSEALTMSDVIVVMNKGRIEQVGTPEEVYRKPNSTFVASFLGSANFLEVHVVAVAATGVAEASFEGRLLQAQAGPQVVAGETATLMVRSENLRVEPAGSSGLGVDGKVSSSAFDGAVIRYAVETPAGILSAEAPGTDSPMPAGTLVRCVFRAEDAWLIATGKEAA